MKTIEQLREAEEDKIALYKDLDNLKARNDELAQQLATSRSVLDQVGHETDLTTGRIQSLELRNVQLEAELNDMSNTLEDAEDQIVALTRNLEKLKIENALRAKKIMDTSRHQAHRETQEKLVVSMKSDLAEENAHLKRETADANLAYNLILSTVTATNMDLLTAQNHHLELELAKANERLTQVNPTPGPISTTLPAESGSSSIDTNANGNADTNEDVDAYGSVWLLEDLRDSNDVYFGSFENEDRLRPASPRRVPASVADTPTTTEARLDAYNLRVTEADTWSMVATASSSSGITLV